jgi:hypothetical protein
MAQVVFRENKKYELKLYSDIMGSFFASPSQRISRHSSTNLLQEDKENL